MEVKMKTTKLVLSIVFFFYTSLVFADVINVPTENHPSIYAGIAGAINGDTVLVQPGTYIENINFNGKLITVASLFLTTQDPTYISSTSIDGDATASVVIFESGEDSTAILCGFTITNGLAFDGGGIYCDNSSPKLENLSIIENSVNIRGGGIYCNNSSGPILQKVIIANNIAYDNGGGIYFSNSSGPILQNVTIANNISYNNGGGIYCDYFSSPSILNSIVWNNSPQEIYNIAGTVIASYSDIQGDWTGVGNIDSNPLFVDTAGGDYHLQATSPCIDAGNPLSIFDPDGTIADMGALYFTQYFGPLWYISTTGSDITGNGSEQFPFVTIQHGINSSTNMDTVLVQPGTYGENINYNGKNISLGSLYFTTADKSYISQTIIDGNTTGSVVTFESGEDSTAILSGFTITDGVADFGGGIYCEDSSPTLTGLEISGNSANNGGGISCDNSSPYIKKVSLSDNSAAISGGGLYTYESNPSLIHVAIVENSATYGGGISSNENSSISLANVTISGNTASNAGGGIECWNNSNPSLINCILWNDSPQEIFLTSSSITTTYSDIESGWTGFGNIDSDPLFVDAGNGDYHLQITSPCIDTGDPSSPLDPDGTITDMGAFYYQYYGPVWHISTIGSDITGTGSEQYPFATIQHGINISSATDTVLVQPGTYFENVNYIGKRITVASLFLTTQDTSYISQTVIDGSSGGRVVTFESEEDSTAILCGFSITNGLADFGGGIICNNSSPYIKNVSILNNSATIFGGGIYCVELCYPKIYNVTITGNTASNAGGGISCHISSPHIKNATINGNSADQAGGGIACTNYSSAYIEDVIIVDNSAISGGGGIHSYSSSVTLQDVTIANNSSIVGGGIYSYYYDSPILWNVIISENTAGAGGGIYCSENGYPMLNNVTITENSAQSGGGIYGNDGTFTSIKNSILWNNSPNEIYDNSEIDISYSDIQGGESGIIGNVVYWNDGNIDSDPLFVDAVNGDYHLQPGSPCIDAGDPSSSSDPDGSIADMGTYYFAHSKINLKVFLQGPFNGTAMNIDLNSSGFIPTNQPYSIAPWNFEGTESVSSIPAGVIDWILVELRDASDANSATPETIIDQQALYLRNDGTVVDSNGLINLQTNNSINNQLFVVIRHRNHIDVMSAYPLQKFAGIYSYDFTTIDQAIGVNATTHLGNGIYGMYAGDANANGQVDEVDNSVVWILEAGRFDYLSSDLNMDGQSDNIDKNDYWLINRGIDCQVPE